MNENFRKKLGKRLIALICAMVTMVSILSNEGSIVFVNAEETATLPDLMITEIYADDIDRNAQYGSGTSDLCEFVEIYNNTNSDINFNEKYIINYKYSSNVSLTVATSSNTNTTAEVIIPANGSAVFWSSRPDLAKMDEGTFRTIMNVPSEVAVYSIVGQNGFNASNREFNIVDKNTNTVISSYYYLVNESGDGQSIELCPTTTANRMKPLQRQAIPSPGVVKTGQLSVSFPRIIITEICCNPTSDFRKPSANEDYEFIEIYNNSDGMLNLKGYSLLYLYPSATYATKAYTFTEDTSIEPYSTFVIWLGKTGISRGFTSVTDFNTNFNSNLKEDDIIQIDNTGFNILNSGYLRGYGISSTDNKADLITDIWVDNTAEGSLDYLTNTVENSSIIYSADSLSSKMERIAIREFTTPGILEPGQVPDRGTDITPPVILWGNETATLDIDTDNEFIMTSDEELSSAKMTYWSEVDIDFSTRVISNVDMTYVSESNGIYTYKANVNINKIGDYYFQFTGTDMASNITSIKRNAPGYSIKVTYQDDGHAPVLTCTDETITSINEGEAMFIPYEYTDSIGVDKISLYYKTTEDGAYKCVDTVKFRIAGKYYVEIPADLLLNYDFVDYYLEAFNVFRSLTTDVKRVNINRIDGFTGIRTNLSEDEIISGEKLIIAKDKQDTNIKVTIDGNELGKNSLLEKGAIFTVSYSGNNAYFKNAISIGNDILTYFAPWTFTMSSKAVFVESSRFTYNSNGSAEITVTVWAGTQGSAFEIGTSVNNDDYTATGMKLVLTDGSIITADNGIDPLKVYKMGDSSGMSEKLDVHFTIPAEKVDACGYGWDTKSVEDGQHTVVLTSTSDTKTIHVVTDNTAPEVSTNITENEEIQGAFNIEFTITDVSGVNNDSLEVYLDGEVFQSPYSFVGSNLLEGEHTITVQVYDNYGNRVEKEIKFTTKNGYPIIKSTSNEKIEDGSIKLVAILDKNTTNTTNVTFYEGSNYVIGDGINVYSGVGDSGENSEPDTLGTVTSQTAQYPYQIFEITTDGAANDTLQVEFESSASYSSPINAYVYDYTSNEWEKLSLEESDGKNTAEFTLLGKVENNMAKVMVQARASESMPETTVMPNDTVENNYVWDGTGIPTQYDFSLAWITDTQYYTESWPENFTIMNKWIVSNKENLDIQYVIHTGDLVDEFEQDYQWVCADENMKLIEDAGLPYGVLAGNHDVAAGNEQFDNYWKYFGEDRFKNSPVYGESYKNNLGHYDLVTVDGQELIMLYMSWDIYTEEIQWMNEVLTKYSDRKAIICVHRYITQAGVLDYTGQLLQNEVVAKNPNVFAVINGHYHGAAINIIGFDDDNDGIKERNVYQICTDYQSADEGGLSYLKMIYFDLQNNKVYMNAYSPLLNDYNLYDTEKLSAYTDGVISYNMDIYELDVDFTQSERSLTTTSFNANLYTTKKIGETKKQENEYATVWTGLVNSEKCGWYASTENKIGLKIRSEVNEFEYRGENGPAITYTVIFKDWDGTILKTETVTEEQSTTAPSNPSREGYTFIGWDKTFNNVTSNQTVTARYRKNQDASENDDDNNNNPTSSDTPSPVPQIEINTINNITTAAISATASIDNRGKATVAVTQVQATDAINKAVEAAEKLGSGGKAAVGIKVKATADVKTVEASLPKTAVDAIADSNMAGLTVSTPIASITFDSRALRTISGAAAVDVKITASTVEITTLSAETQQVVGDRPVYDFSVTSGSNTISEFGGNVTVSVPYTPKSGEDINAVVMYFINAEGKPEIVSNCKYDPATGSITFTTNHFSKYAVGYNKVNFKDVVANEWYSDAVSFVAARGITSGTGNGNFSPEGKLTRGQFVVMVMRAYGIAPDENAKDNFSDAGSTYYTGYLAAAKRMLISEGTGNNTFTPEKEITRQEMFTILYNTLKVIEELPIGRNEKELSAYEDEKQIASWAKEAMSLFVKTGIVSGSGGNLNPSDLCNRSQMAQVLYNLLGK